MPEAEDKRGSLGSILKGMMLLSVGNREGLNCFSNSVDGFVASLAPQLALLIVGSVQIFFVPERALVLTKLLLAFCVLLIPPAVSQIYAQLWKKNDLWLRYITAATWCTWVVAFLSMFCMIVTMTIAPRFVDQPQFLEALAVCSALYEFWLQWFIAKYGLNVSGLKAAFLYMSVLAVIVVLYYVVAYFPPHYHVLDDIIGPVKIEKTH